VNGLVAGYPVEFSFVMSDGSTKMFHFQNLWELTCDICVKY